MSHSEYFSSEQLDRIVAQLERIYQESKPIDQNVVTQQLERIHQGEVLNLESKLLAQTKGLISAKLLETGLIRENLNEQVLSCLSLNKILAWAESLPSDTVVGYTAVVYNCPVFRYLKECGFNPRCVTSSSIRGQGFFLVAASRSRPYGGMPRAITRLIYLVDEQGSRRTPITAQTLVMLVQQLQNRKSEFC